MKNDKYLVGNFKGVDQTLDLYTKLANSLPDGPLSVSDVERLAKAGVVINLADLAGHIVPDRPPETLDPWAKAVRDRWMMNPETQTREAHNWSPTRFCCGAHGETVFVFVHMYDHAPVLLEDHIHLFPSDALMAKIHLLRKVAP